MLKGHFLIFKCFDRPRSAKEPPFFFKEVRLGMLTLSILYNIARLVYELTIMDISVILVATRLLLTTLQLVDQWWFCKNWESFFLEKKMRAWIWFRLFIAVSMWSLLFCLQTTFNTSYAMMGNDTFLWAGGLQTMLWYYWGKHWKFQWGDMSDERRIPAFVGTLITSSFLYAGLAVFVRESDQQQSAITTAITATMAYFLMGLSFQYLHRVTNHNLSEKTIDPIPLPSSIPTPVRTSIKKVAVIADEANHDIEVFRVPEEKIDMNRPFIDVHTRTVYPFASPPVSPTNSSSSMTTTEMSPSLLENGINHGIDGVSQTRVKPIYVPIISPIISPVISRHGSFSHTDDHGHITPIIADCNEDVNVDQNSQLKPTNNNPLSASSSLLPSTTAPLDSSSPLPVLVSQKGRRSSLENLMYYETSHLLSDKIVVVFVQVVTTYPIPFHLPLSKLSDQLSHF